MAAKPDPIFDRAKRDYEIDKVEHDKNVEVFDRRYRAYRGIIELRSQAAEWTPKFHPAHVWQAIETMVANLVDANPHWRLHVHPQMASPERMEELREGARANELLLRHQLTLDHWAEKQRPFDLQGLIMGVTAAKQSWAYREGQRRYWENYSEPVISGPFGFQVGQVEKQRELAAHEVLRDDPTSEVIDVRHLIFQRGATSLASSDRVTHRCYYSIDQLKRLECRVNGGKLHEGPCEPGRYYHNVSELRDPAGVRPDRFQREEEVFGDRPHRDDVEVLEQWRIEDGVLKKVCIGDEKVLLAAADSPYWFDHLEHPYPFVVCSGAPDLFRIQGISAVEMVAELQEMLWTIGGQRIANLELVNNAIVMVADDLEDQELTIAPHEVWMLPRPVKESVEVWAPDIRGAQVSLEAEALIKGDLQNVMGGMPFLGGTDSQGIDQETATGVSIVTSLAQKRVAAQRQQYVWAKGRIGEQFTALNQQYIREPRMVPVVGEDGVQAFEEVRPELLKGLFLFETEMVEESLNRETKRAEQQAKFNAVMPHAATLAMMGTPINGRAFVEDILDSYDVTDKERYFSEQPPMGLPPGAPPPAAPNGAGVTNPEAAAGQLAPSNANSMNPEAAMQQFMAQRGTPSG